MPPALPPFLGPGDGAPPLAAAFFAVDALLAGSPLPSGFFFFGVAALAAAALFGVAALAAPPPPAAAFFAAARFAASSFIARFAASSRSLAFTESRDCSSARRACHTHATHMPHT